MTAIDRAAEALAVGEQRDEWVSYESLVRIVFESIDTDDLARIIRRYWPEAGGQAAFARAQVMQQHAAEAIKAHLLEGTQ